MAAQKSKAQVKAKAKPQAQKRKVSESGVKKEAASPCSSRGGSPQKAQKRQRVSMSPERIPGIDVILKILSDDRLELPSGNCRDMFVNMAPHALCTGSDDRQALQTTAVEILDEALRGFGEQVNTRTKRAQEKAAEASEALVVLESNVTRCQEELEAQVTEVATRKEAVAQATSCLQEAKGKLDEAKKVQAQAEAARALCLAEKEACVDLMEGSYKSLKEGKWGTDFAKQREQVDDVVNFMKSVKTVSVPSSLIFIEGPSVLRSKKDSRGAHAEAIFKDIENVFNKHLASIEERLTTENEKTAAVLPNTQAAEEAAEQAVQAKENNIASSAATEARQAELTKELRQHNAAVAAQRGVVEATKASNDKVLNDQPEIEQAFQKCMQAFTVLRDQSPEAYDLLSGTPSPGRGTAVEAA